MEKEAPKHTEDLSSRHTSENASPTEVSETDQSQDDFKWDFDVVSNLAALYVCFFASTWMLIVPSSTIGFIVKAFPLEAEKSVWIATAITITNCVLSTFLGLLSDILGRKPFLLIGMAFGIAGSLVGGRASNMGMVIGGQVLCSAGLSLGYLAIALTSEMVPKYHRPLTQALTGVFAGLATLTGAIIAGAFIKHNVSGEGQGWRMGFYLGAAFCALSFLAIFFFYHPGPRPNPEGLPITKRLIQIDWIGIFLVAAGLTLFLVGIFYGGNPYKWTSARVLAPIIVGAVICIVFGLWEWKATKNGLLAHVFFEHRNFAISLALNFVGGIVLFGGQAFLPQEIIQLYTSDAVMTGVYNLPFNFFSISGGVVLFLIMKITKDAKGATVFGLTIIVIGAGLMAVMQPHINYAAWFFPTALLGLSVGIQTAAIPIFVSVCTPNELIGSAIMISNSARSFGGSIGTVIFQQIFSSKIKQILPKKVAMAVVKAGLPISSVPLLLEASAAEDPTLLQKVPGVTPAVLLALQKSSAQAYADSFRYIWYSLLAFSAVTAVMSLFLRSTTKQMTREIAAEIEHHHHHDERKSKV